MKPNIVPDKAENVLPKVFCGKCDYPLHFHEYFNERGVPCISTRVIPWRFCPNCGEPIDFPHEESTEV